MWAEYENANRSPRGRRAQQGRQGKPIVLKTETPSQASISAAKMEDDQRKAGPDKETG